MKKNLFFAIGTLIGMSMVMLTSCTKEGPIGPAGTDGKDGVDANTLCLGCHTATKMDATQSAFEMTKHVVGSSWDKGTSASCGRCHSHEAYVEFVETGVQMAAVNSTPLECGTCHTSHSFKDAVAAPLRNVADVVSKVGGGAYTFAHGKGNICATCHQAKTDGSAYDNGSTATYTKKFTGADIAVYQGGSYGPAGSATLNATSDTLTVVFDVSAGYVYVNSLYAGPHHGPQANTFAGILAYPTDGTAFTRAGHTDCVACHLNDLDGVGSSHNFSPNLDNCNVCHATGTNLEELMANNQTELDAIAVKLEQMGLIKFVDGATAPYTIDKLNPMYSSSSQAHFQAFYNFIAMSEDKSKGAHNPAYYTQMIALAKTNLGL